MGFFSWECPVCNKSIKNKYSSMPNDECVIVLPSELLEGVIDGYGSIGGFNFMDRDIIPTLFTEKIKVSSDGTEYREYINEIKMYHKGCYEKAGKPDYEHAKFSHPSDDQGFFF